MTLAPHPGRRFIILRHGLTDWNVEGRMQGTSDFSRLTPLGVSQAVGAGVGLSRLLAGEVITTVYASPLSRAQQTLELAATQWPEAASVVGQHVVLDDLKEIELREWSGLLSRDVQRDAPDVYR